MSFMGLKGGDRVRFYLRSGTDRHGAVYVERVAKVQMLLTFPDHVVVNLGGRYGTPAVVNADNFISKVGGGK